LKCSALLTYCRECKELNKDKLEKCATCGADMHCKDKAVEGYKNCKRHGGPNPQNNYYGSHKMKNGMNSQFELTRLAARYAQMQESGVLMSNRAAVDVVDNRIKQLLDRTDLEEAPDRVVKLYGLWNEYINEESQVELVVLKKKLSDEFEKVYHDYAAWKQIFEALDLRSKMVEREIKIIKELKGIMTVEDGRELMAQLMGAVMRVIGEDSQKLRQVQYEFTRISGEVSDLVVEGDSETIGGDGGAVGGQEGFGELDQEGILDT